MYERNLVLQTSSSAQNLGLQTSSSAQNLVLQTVGTFCPQIYDHQKH